MFLLPRGESRAIITKRFILDVAAVLDPSLVTYFYLSDHPTSSDSNQIQIKIQFQKIMNYMKRVTKNFQGRGVFLELGHLHKDSPTTQERKVPQGKNHQFFCLETLKNCILSEKFYPQMTTIRAFSRKLGHFFPMFEKGQGRPPPSSPLQLRSCIWAFWILLLSFHII